MIKGFMVNQKKIHEPVLLSEVLEGLAIQPDGIYIDATFGRGGHSRAILEKLNPAGRLIALDKDPQAIAFGATEFGQDTRFTLVRSSFAALEAVAKQQGVAGNVNGILLDLGVSSPQLDEASRGFSFIKDGPLDMRMDPEHGISAAEWINTAKESEIMNVLKEFGEERFARRIAGAIVKERAMNPFETTLQLAEVIAKANPAWERFKHPATRSFQAIRIFINSELTELQKCLAQCLQVLKTNGRLLVISFHSLEDRLVKRFMKQHARGDDFPAYLPVRSTELGQRLKIIGSGVKASEKELANNIRARSAVLRIAEKML